MYLYMLCIPIYTYVHLRVHMCAYTRRTLYQEQFKFYIMQQHAEYTYTHRAATHCNMYVRAWHFAKRNPALYIKQHTAIHSTFYLDS